MRVFGKFEGKGWGGLTMLAMLAGLPLSPHGQAVDSSLSFFVTSVGLGQGGNLGGLSGADAHCQQLAAAAGAGGKAWRAYLSTQPANGVPAVNARDRIGPGPWFNANKVKIASNIAELHGTNNLTAATALTQTGAVIAGNRHDILTGTRADGTAYGAGADSTCANWTSDAAAPARCVLGHCNRMGGGVDPTSWVAAHISNGCSQALIAQTGSAANFYCFAVNTPTGTDSRKLRERVGAASDHISFFLGAGMREQQVVYRFSLDRESRVEVSVFDLQGQRRAVLLHDTRKAGSQEVVWDGTDAQGAPLPAGNYLIFLKRDGQIAEDKRP